MVRRRKISTKILASLMLAIFILTSFPFCVLAVTEPNPEGYKTTDRVTIGVRQGSQYEDYGYTCYGQWDVKVNGSSKGKCLYFQQLDYDKGINAIHESKVAEWATEFNGSTEYVNSNVQAYYNLVYPLPREGGSPTKRVHIRDLAELCGMSYTNSVVWKPGPTKWQPGEVNVFPTKYPGTYLNVPTTANPGATVKWQIGGESFVKSEISKRRDKIAYTLKQNGKILETNTLMTRKFSSSGTVTLPSNAKPGDTFKFELAVSDGVGRVSTISKNVFIPGAGVKPPPSEPPEKPEPPEPPAPPNYEPVADFFIDGAPTIEGEQVTFRDHSKHPGAKYGETIVNYEWNIQGLPGASGKTATATWDKVGTYKVTLTVEDQDGDSDSCTKSVVVGPALPAAEIFMSSGAIIMGREVHINGDGSTAACNRDIKWDEMLWEIYNPAGEKITYTTNVSHLFNDDKYKTNSVLDQTGMWKFRLKVKDTENNESEWTERTLQVFPDQPPKADFWLINEALRNSYKGYELTIYDQSEPGSPDGSLGDEITQRNWVLYYDANNNGNFTDSVDEVIYPGVTGKAARLITTSTNDNKPKIQFSKTGRYKVELTVTESYSAWGETCTGKSDNTLDKPAAEKEIVVINLAPTVAFDIKKKMPVDVLFATDCTISDSKYSSLQSGQAEFINKLMGGHIDPVTEVKRVGKGDIVEKYSLSGLAYENQYRVGFGDWNYFTGNYSPDFVLNGSTGERRNLGRIRIEHDNGDGTAFVRLNSYNRPMQLVDENLNVLWSPPFGAYEEHIGERWRSIDKYWAEDGSYYVLRRAEEPYPEDDRYVNITLYLYKISKEMRAIEWVRPVETLSKIYKSSCKYDNYQYSLVYNSYNSSDKKIIVATRFNESSSSSAMKNLSLYSVTSAGSKRLSIDRSNYNGLSWDSGYQCALATKNNRYVVKAKREGLFTYDGQGLISSRYHENDYVLYVGDYVNNQTAVLFLNEEAAGNGVEDVISFYTVDNNNAQITLRGTYRDIFTGKRSQSSGSFRSYFNWQVWKLDSVIGVKLSEVYGSSGSWSVAECLTPIMPNYTLGTTKGPFYSPEEYQDGVWFMPINDNVFAYYHSKNNRHSDYDDIEYWIYSKDGRLITSCNARASEIKNCLYPLGPLVSSLEDGKFIASTLDRYYCYTPTGSLLWSIPKTQGLLGYRTSELFMGFIVLKSGNTTKLVNPNNGQIVKTIDYKYLEHGSDYLLTEVPGINPHTVLCFAQLQGLKYLGQAINSHTWDGNKMNFIVSVIDGKYPDFAGSKAEIEQALRDNHVKFTSISPAEVKAQTEELAKNGESGFWVPTASTMPGPLTELANKIIATVNEERGADCVVLVNQEFDLTNKYNDAENDPAALTEWRFRQNPYKLGDFNISNSMGYSTINGKTFSTPPKSFDKVGTYYVNCRAKDKPITNAEYLTHFKAGQKWSSSDAELTVLVHRKPIATFTMSSSTTMDGTGLDITDTSYDPDLVNRDPEGKDGLRVWQWQYRPAGGDWISSSDAPRTFPSQGTFQVRLRVQDYHGAWSNWTDIKTLEVRNTPPIASFSAYPNPVQKGTNCTLTDHSMDPDGDKITNYEWNIQGIGTRTYTTPDPFPVAWANTGSYTVTLKVQDSHGAWSAPFSQTVEVIDNKKPVAVLSLPATGYADEQFTANGTSSYDPDPGDRVQMAYWQYKKPGQSEWSGYITQRYGEAGFLKLNFLPSDTELGVWSVKLVVEDTHGFKSDPVIKNITIQEGWEITGQIIPEVGERGRYMIVAAYAHRKGKPNEKYQIDSVKAELAYLDAACTISGRAAAEGIETLNMPYDTAKADYRVKYLVGQEIYQTNRWPADGTYYIKVTGQKGTTRKEIALPFSIKGNIWEKLYIRTYSW